MSQLILKLEKKLGRYALDKLPLIMIICYATGYILEMVNTDIIFLLSLNPYAILHGQIWRLFTWILIPPDSSNRFLVLIMLYFYYSISNSLMYTWGKFYFNLYIFAGFFFMVIGAFVFYGYSLLFDAGTVAAYSATDLGFMYGHSYYYAVYSQYFSTYYVNMSILLAYAATFPDAVVYIFFVLPVKMKALGIIYGIILVYEAWSQGTIGLMVFGAAFLNFIVFFLVVRKNLRRPQDVIRKAREAAAKKEKERKERVSRMKPASGIAKHRCAICGQTSESNPDLEFRFCSKCEGNFEYCQNHLFTHTHVTRDNYETNQR